MAGKVGAPLGNKNGAGKRVWSDAVRKVIAQGKSLDKLAQSLVDKALEGDVAALRELGDRLEGKVTQPIGGEADNPIVHEVIYRIAQPRD